MWGLGPGKWWVLGASSIDKEAPRIAGSIKLIRDGVRVCEDIY